jgi:hypothetical protein
MSFEYTQLGPNVGSSPYVRTPNYKLPFKKGLNKVSGGDIEDIETGDPMRLMPRLRQIHKMAYRLQGHKDVQGLRIAIENRRGSVRKGKTEDGHEWRTKMIHPYGYIVGTKGADNEPVDAYVGPHEDAPNAYVVHQHKVDGKGYDEDKVMLGFRSKREAKEAYLKHYDDPKFLGPVSRVSVDRLRELVSSKRKLVKISSVRNLALFDELEKLSFDEEDALKSYRAHRHKIVTPPMRHGEGTITGSLARQYGLSALGPGTRSTIVSQMSNLPDGPVKDEFRRAAAVASKLEGKIIKHKGEPLRIARHAMDKARSAGMTNLYDSAGDVRANLQRISNAERALSPTQRMMANSAIIGHEASESIQRAVPGPFRSLYQHANAQPVLNDNNIAATLPRRHVPVKEYVSSLREGEGKYLERATRGVSGRGVGFGEMRFSRHARKHLTRRMDELADAKLQQVQKARAARVAREVSTTKVRTPLPTRLSSFAKRRLSAASKARPIKGFASKLKSGLRLVGKVRKI